MKRPETHLHTLLGSFFRGCTAPSIPNVWLLIPHRLLVPPIVGPPSECTQVLYGWIQDSLAVELPNLAGPGNPSYRQTRSDGNQGLTSLFPTSQPAPTESLSSTQYIGIIGWQSESSQQHFLNRIRTEPVLEQVRFYGNKVASFCPRVESVLVHLELSRV